MIEVDLRSYEDKRNIDAICLLTQIMLWALLEMMKRKPTLRCGISEYTITTNEDNNPILLIHTIDRAREEEMIKILNDIPSYLFDEYNHDETNILMQTSTSKKGVNISSF